MTVLALSAPAEALANDQGGASGQPTQAAPPQSPAASQQNSDDSTSTVASVGVLGGLLALSGALVAFTQLRARGSRPDSD